MKEYKSVKDQLLEYYMAQDHTPYTDTVIKVLSLTDPEIEEAPAYQEFEDINIVVAIPREDNMENLRVEINDPTDPITAESSAQGAARNPPSGTTYSRPNPTRRHEASFQSGPIGGSYRSGRTSGFRRFNIPEDYVPERKFSMDVLEIDCLPDNERRKRIEAWHNSMILIIATDTTLMDDFSLTYTLMLNKTLGLAHKLLKGIDRDQFMRGTSEDFLKNVVNLSYSVFLGTNYLNDGENQIRIEQEESRQRLTRLQICDLCELDAFTCDYEKHLFNIPNQEWTLYIEAYLRKIPYIGPMVVEEYKNLPPISKLSLAVAKNMVRKKLTTICTDRMLAKRTKKINLCCPEFQGPETMYGCQTIPKLRKWKKKYRFSKPKQKRYYKTSKRFKKYWKQPRYKKRFFKKHRNRRAINDEPQEAQPKDKPKFCPQKKKDCKCWICQEVGHYSYECPNTKNNKAQARVLEEIIDTYDLAPLEDTFSDLSSDEELYLLEFDTEGEIEMSDYDYSTTSDSEDQE